MSTAINITRSLFIICNLACTCTCMYASAPAPAHVSGQAQEEGVEPDRLSGLSHLPVRDIAQERVYRVQGEQ